MLTPPSVFLGLQPDLSPPKGTSCVKGNLQPRGQRDLKLQLPSRGYSTPLASSWRQQSGEEKPWLSFRRHDSRTRRTTARSRRVKRPALSLTGFQSPGCPFTCRVTGSINGLMTLGGGTESERPVKPGNQCYTWNLPPISCSRAFPPIGV